MKRLKIWRQKNLRALFSSCSTTTSPRLDITLVLFCNILEKHRKNTSKVSVGSCSNMKIKLSHQRLPSSSGGTKKGRGWAMATSKNNSAPLNPRKKNLKQRKSEVGNVNNDCFLMLCYKGFAMFLKVTLKCNNYEA